MRSVDVSADLLPRHREVLRCLNLLARQVDREHWCVVGGMMVLLVGKAEGATVPRANQTKDGDVVLDVLAEERIMQRASNALRQLGFSLPEPFHTTHGDRDHLARCTYVCGSASIDLLGPDDAPEPLLTAEDGATSIRIPGGRRALELSQLIEVFYDDELPEAVFRTPTLHGAVVTKAAAVIDPRTAGQLRHLEDTTFLLSIIDNPREIAEQLSDDDRRLLRAVATLMDERGSPGMTHRTPEQRARARATITLFTS